MLRLKEFFNAPSDFINIKQWKKNVNVACATAPVEYTTLIAEFYSEMSLPCMQLVGIGITN